MLDGFINRDGVRDFINKVSKISISAATLSRRIKIWEARKFPEHIKGSKNSHWYKEKSVHKWFMKNPDALL